MKTTKTEEVKTEEVVKPVKNYEISDIVTLKDTLVCPDGYEEVTLEEDIELLHLKSGDKVFVPTVERLKTLGRL
ncbi:MAG: hypothetical protein M0R06_06925 [Sphaerochaeta sp.]|jgi:hypothetical protein|nr:hypothetical protein [Sphaerochaeta sp.]